MKTKVCSSWTWIFDKTTADRNIWGFCCAETLDMPFFMCDPGFTKKGNCNIYVPRPIDLYIPTCVCRCWYWARPNTKLLFMYSSHNVYLLCTEMWKVGPDMDWLRMGEKPAAPWHGSLSHCSMGSSTPELAQNHVWGKTPWQGRCCPYRRPCSRAFCFKLNSI